MKKITWKQAEGYFKEKDIAIIPVGSTENHGSQLCLGTDFLIPRRLCEMMDERLNILIAPTVPFGVGDQHINFPGTITIGYDGLYNLMTRIVDQLYGFGIRKFVFLNGHGGNTPVLQRVALELDERHAMGAILKLVAFSRRTGSPVEGGHGGGEETAAMLAIDPSCVHMEYFMPFEPKDLSPDLTFAGSFNVNLQWRFRSGASPRGPLFVLRLVRPRLPGKRPQKEWGRRNVKGHSGFLRGLYKEV